MFFQHLLLFPTYFFPVIANVVLNYILITHGASAASGVCLLWQNARIKICYI